MSPILSMTQAKITCLLEDKFRRHTITIAHEAVKSLNKCTEPALWDDAQYRKKRKKTVLWA